MRFRDRQDESGPGSRGETVARSPVSGDLDRLRDAGESLLAAGQAAIDRALSGNSEAFLDASRQEGGQ
jgi:hypothetical protein